MVEDNADMRGYLTRLLRQDGWLVPAVCVGGRRASRPGTPDLVLTDVMMPARAGSTCCGCCGRATAPSGSR